MTNAEIIFRERLNLVEQGILKQYEDGEIQPLHTFAGWKTLGYQVKKGEKAVAKFGIWKYIKPKREEVDVDGNPKKGRCYIKQAAFFTDTQVEKLEVV